MLDHNGNRTTFILEAMVAWVFLEVLAALAIALAIVWWTFPKKPRADDADARERDDEP